MQSAFCKFLSDLRVVLSVSLCLCGWGCAATGAAPDFEKAKAYLEEGRSAAGRGDHTAAVDFYTSAIRQNPEFPEAYAERGFSNVQLRLGPDAAVNASLYETRAFDDFSKALRYNPAYAAAYFNRAMLLASVGKHRLAVDDLLNAERFNPRDPATHLELGLLYEHKFEDKIRDAMKHYEAYVSLGGTDAEVREKVRLWKELLKQVVPPSKGPTPEEEKRAEELHESFKKLFNDGKKDEAVKTLEELVARYGHTAYVQKRARELNAVLNALKKQ